MKKLFFAVLSIGAPLWSWCTEPETRLIRATSDMVDIRDGERLLEKYWRLVPEEELDVYETENGYKDVTFYTDIESITFSVEPDKTYDFIILLNGVDSARTRIHTVPSKLEILRRGALYDFSDRREIPQWTYLPPDNADLVRIRTELKLDSIAGNGDEISRIKNLMYWVHDAVPHDGSSYNPDSKNAVDLIEVCRREDRGVNCRMMATILNECYLAMGIPSRFVTCMPRELDFDDCHVINTVYSRDLGKWVWMDPTFAAYVEDGNGNLLGLEEVRLRLVDDEPLVLNPDANWNHEEIQTKEYYLDWYMAKNLYRMSCPVASTYNTETWHHGKQIDYIELLPLDGINQEPQKNDRGSGVYYITNNPDLFWALPQDGI